MITGPRRVVRVSPQDNRCYISHQGRSYFDTGTKPDGQWPVNARVIIRRLRGRNEGHIVVYDLLEQRYLNVGKL